MERLMATYNFWQKYRQKEVTVWIKFGVFICIKQCLIQKTFSTVSTLWVPEKSVQKLFPVFFQCIFYGKTEIIYKYLRSKNLFKLHKCSSLNASSVLNGTERVLLYHPRINFKKWYAQKTSGCGTVICFIKLDFWSQRLTALLWTTVTKATRSRKMSGRFIFRDCPWGLK